ncbi:hypothetical protein [Streptomyces sp. HC307]
MKFGLLVAVVSLVHRWWYPLQTTDETSQGLLNGFTWRTKVP